MAFVAVLKLFRFPLVFTAVADSAAGYLIARGADASWPVLGLLAAASGGLYCFGMAMNDVADLERDRGLYPNRVLPSGRLTRNRGIAAAIGALALSGVAVAAVPDAPLTRLGIWGGVVFLILAYDFFLKHPPVMGLIRAFNVLLGVTCAGFLWGKRTGAAPPGLVLAGASFLYVTALTAVSTFEDRAEAGMGRTAGLGAGLLLMILAALVPAAGWPVWKGIPVRVEAVVAGALLAGWIGVRAGRILVGQSPAAIRLLVRDGVAGIIVLDASMVLACGHTGPGLAVAALLIPAVLAVWGFKKLRPP